MPEEPTPGATPAVTPASTPAPAATNPPELQAGDGQEQISLEEARKLRKEAQALRNRLKGYEDAEEQAKVAALSEVEKATQRATAAEQRIAQIQQQYVTAQIQLAAQKKNIIDPEIAALAVQKTLEYDQDGMPTNLEKALDQLIKNKPYLVPQANQAPSASLAQTARPPLTPAMNPGRSNIPSPNQLTPGKRYKLSDLL